MNQAFESLQRLGYKATMTFWMILSWVVVVILTAVNIFVFLKLKKASEQMMKMAFPGAKNMNDAVGQMQRMMSQMGGGRMNDPRMKAAMDMLQGHGKPRR